MARQIFSFGAECWSFEVEPVASETSWMDKLKRRQRRQWFCRVNWPWDTRRPKYWATREPNSCGTARMMSISPVINRLFFFSIRLSLGKSLVIVSWAAELNWLPLLIVGKHHFLLASHRYIHHGPRQIVSISRKSENHSFVASLSHNVCSCCHEVWHKSIKMRNWRRCKYCIRYHIYVTIYMCQTSFCAGLTIVLTRLILFNFFINWSLVYGTMKSCQPLWNQTETGFIPPRAPFPG